MVSHGFSSEDERVTFIKAYHNDTVPAEAIPEAYRMDLPLLGGGTQAVDGRWGTWFFCHDLNSWVPRYAAEIDENFEYDDTMLG